MSIVGGLPAQATLDEWLVHVDARVRLRAAQAAITRHEQDRAEAGGVSDTGRADGAGEMAHGIVDRQPGLNRAAWRADVQVDLALRTFSRQEEQLRHHQAAHTLLNRAIYHDDTLAQQPRKNVVGALAAPGGFDNCWDE